MSGRGKRCRLREPASRVLFSAKRISPLPLNSSLTEEEKRKVFAYVVARFVKLFCETQTYSWRGKHFLQLTGLPIGPRGTSAIARVVMNTLDALFLEVLEKLDIHLKLKLRYIDDLRTILLRILAGVTIRDGKLVIDK